METYLPEELTEIILCHKNLSINDVVNFSLTNKYYYDVIRNNNILWKKKYFQIWPQLLKLFENHDPDFCWYEEIEYGYNLKRKTREKLYTMSLHFCEHYQLFGPHFSEWMKLYEETPRTYYYLVHDLKNIVNTRADINTIEVVPISTPGNKTLQYYASKVLRYLLCSRFVHELHGKLPLRLQPLETAIVVVTQWCQPNFDVSWKDVIPNKFDELAQKVKEHLKVVHPNHPLFAVPKEELKIWREEDIDGNKYDADNCKKVVQALESVLDFSIDSRGGIGFYRENEFLHEIFQLPGSDVATVYGVYAGLLLTYQCVARRLGLKCEIWIYDSLHPVLLTPSNFSNIREHMLQRAELPFATTEQFDPIKAIHQYRFSRPSLCPGLHLLELLEAASPFNMSSKTFMEQRYVDTTNYVLLLRSETDDPRLVKRKVMKILREESKWKKIVNNSQEVRPPNLKYAVGMAMKHVTERYKCVIYDWDSTCFYSHKWQRQNEIHLLDLQNNQPFYSVLTEYGDHEYIAQECLEPWTDIAPLIIVKDIGRHFSHVVETYFVPNEAKERKYPADAAVRHMFHQKLKSDNLKS